MEIIQRLVYKDKDIMIVDYSNCGGDKMIAVFESAKEIVLLEKGHYLVLSVFNNRTHINEKFMGIVQEELPKIDQYIDKQAIVGLSEVQVWIVKAMNLWYKRQIFPFDSMQEALEFLVKD